MARATKSEMDKIASIQTEDVSSFITVANLLVEREVVPATGMDEDQLAILENWLAVHFTKVMEPPTKSESISGAVGVSETFAIDVGKGLNATIYGQQAMILDDTGRLLALQNNGKASVGIRSVQTYYRDPLSSE